MFEGWFGERKTQFNLWFSLNKELYRRFHDVIFVSVLRLSEALSEGVAMFSDALSCRLS